MRFDPSLYKPSSHRLVLDAGWGSTLTFQNRSGCVIFSGHVDRDLTGMSLVILVWGKGEASFFGTYILLGKANKPSFIDVCMWTSAEMQLESLYRDSVP